LFQLQFAGASSAGLSTATKSTTNFTKSQQFH